MTVLEISRKVKYVKTLVLLLLIFTTHHSFSQSYSKQRNSSGTELRTDGNIETKEVGGHRTVKSVPVDSEVITGSSKKQPRVGRKAASSYFEKSVEPIPSKSYRTSDRLIMLSIGSYVSSTSYAWAGSARRTDIGKSSYGLTYALDPSNSYDTNVRLDFSEYRIDEFLATKMSVMPLYTFPSVESRFPLYFGVGFGLGVFFQQVEKESPLSFDYQLVGGLRFQDLYRSAGFFTELAMKNHLHLLSDGQLNATSLTMGGVFSF